MSKKGIKRPTVSPVARPIAHRANPSALLETRIVSGCETWTDNFEQLAKLRDACVDGIYIDPLINSNRTVEQSREVFWVETKQKRSFDDRHASTVAYIEYMHAYQRDTLSRDSGL